MPRFIPFAVCFLAVGQVAFTQAVSVSNPGVNPVNFDLSHPEPGTLAFILFGDGKFEKVESRPVSGLFPSVQHAYLTPGAYTTRVFYAARYKDVLPPAMQAPPSTTVNTTASGVPTPFIMTGNVSISTSWNPSPTSDHITVVSVKNPSNCPRNGTVNIYYKSAELDYFPQQGISQFTPSTVAGNFNRLIAATVQFGPNEVKHFFLRTRIKSATSSVMAELSLPQNACGPAVLSSATNTMTAAKYPHDPNSKTVNPDSICYQQQPVMLNYTIKFHNDGDAPVNTVNIEDVLDSQLDPSTVALVASSHSATYSLSGNILVVTFAGIDMPGSGQTDDFGQPVDFDKTVGSFTFSIMTNGCLQPSVIFNMASIFFDNLDPIATTMAGVEIVSDGCTPDANYCPTTTPRLRGPATIYASPNPFQGDLSIRFDMDGTDAPLTLTVYDLFGRVVARPLDGMALQPGRPEETIDLSHLKAGVYRLALRQGGRLETLMVVKI